MAPVDQTRQDTDETVPPADATRTTTTNGAEPSGTKRPSPGAAASGRQTAEPDPHHHTSQHVDDLLSTLPNSEGPSGRAWSDDGEHRQTYRAGALEGLPPILDERTVQAIKAFEPSEDTLPDIERLLLSAAR